MKKVLLFLIILLFGSTPLIAADLVIVSGAGLMEPMEEIKKNFEEQQDIKIDLHYGGWEDIFDRLSAGKACDIIIPGDKIYTLVAHKNGWIAEKSIHYLVVREPVIVVPDGNPANIKTLADFARKGVKVSIGDTKPPAIGWVAMRIFNKAGFRDKVKPNIQVYAPTADQLLMYVAREQVDAAIIWKDLTTWAEGKEKIEVVRIPNKKNIIKTISTAICTQTENRDMAEKFNKYIASDKGLNIWEKWGFERCTK